jgi:hypothetical protein
VYSCDRSAVPPHAPVPWRARESVALLLYLPPPREGNHSLVLCELRLFAHFLPGCDEEARHRPGLVYGPLVVLVARRAHPLYQSVCVPAHIPVWRIPYRTSGHMSVQVEGGL